MLVDHYLQSIVYSRYGAAGIVGAQTGGGVSDECGGFCTTPCNCAVGCSSLLGFSSDTRFSCQNVNIKTGYTATKTKDDCQNLFNSPSKVCPAYTGGTNPDNSKLWQKGYSEWITNEKNLPNTKTLEDSTWLNFISNYDGMKQSCCYCEKSNLKCEESQFCGGKDPSACCSIDNKTPPADTTYGKLTFS